MSCWRYLRLKGMQHNTPAMGPASDPFGSGRLGRDLITEWRVFVALTEVQGQPKSACHACGVGFLRKMRVPSRWIARGLGEVGAVKYNQSFLEAVSEFKQ